MSAQSIESLPPGYNPKGERMHSVPARHQREYRISDGHAHLILTYRKDGSVHVRLLQFDKHNREYSLQYLMEREVFFFAFALMEIGEVISIVLRDVKMNDLDYAKSQGWNFGLHGYYLRTDHRLQLPNKGTGMDGDPNVSVRLYKTLRMKLKRWYRRNHER